MSKSIHIDIDDTIVESLGITERDYPGMVTSGNLDISKVLVSENGTKFNELDEILQGQDDNIILSNYKGKKAFVVPGCDISMEKLKHVSKEHGIKLTNDLDDADIILTHIFVSDDIHNTDPIPLKKLMFSFNNGYALTSIGTTHNIWAARTNEAFENYGHIIYDKRLSSIFNLHSDQVEYESLPYDTYVYSGLAIKILDKIINHNIVRIKADTLIEESPNQRAITEDLMNQALAMYDAGNEDRELLVKMLPTFRTDINHHYLWNLCRNINDYNLPRDKDCKHWLNKVNYDSLNRMSPEDFITRYDQTNELTPAGFKFAEPECRQEIRIHNRELYSFKVQIKPEYHKYLKIKKDE